MAFIEQAMSVTLADSLRELMRALLAELQQAVPKWQVTANPRLESDAQETARGSGATR